MWIVNKSIFILCTIWVGGVKLKTNLNRNLQKNNAPPPWWLYRPVGKETDLKGYFGNSLENLPALFMMVRTSLVSLHWHTGVEVWPRWLLSSASKDSERMETSIFAGRNSSRKQESLISLKFLFPGSWNSPDLCTWFSLCVFFICCKAFCSGFMRSLSYISSPCFLSSIQLT